ncbi:MAG: hypothetical protein GF320_15540, partial [Armatimonadia bacterium]|nr:hypothetical protein [Armatimonadia bacterium]
MRTLTWIGLPVLLTSAAGAQEPLHIPCDSLDDVTLATGSARLEVREDDGRAAIAMIDQSLGSATLAFDPAVPVEPGRAYVMAIDMRAAGLRSCQVQPTVTFIDADGEGLDYMTGDWVVGMAPWRRVRVVAVAPEDATHAILGVHGMTASMTPLPEDHRTGTALVDDIQWTAAPRIEVTSSAPGNVVEEGQPIELAFSATHVPEGADWSWRAETVDWRGDATFQADTPGLRDGLTWQSEYDGLGRGYYELRWSVDRDGEMVYQGREAFAVVPPLAEQPYDPGSQIALDAGFSWFVAEDPERLALAAHLARMAGLTCLRDRLSWARTNPAEGTLEWDPYDDAAAAQNAEGLTVYQVFHDCPSWAAETGDDPVTPHTAPPRDLRDVYGYFHRAAAEFDDEIPFWEIWNEPDIFFFGGRPEEYAGILKAAYLGCHHGNPEARVLLGSLAHPPEEWYRRAFECGLTDYFDTWNMHYYGAPEGVIERIEGNRKLMLSHGHEKPIWITEMGVPAHRADDGTFTASERDQAAYLVKAYGHSLGHGVDRFFYFFMHEFLEAAANLWGITRADLTPKPAYMALAQLAHLAGDRHCVGRLDVGDEGLYAYAWGPEDDAIVAVWTSGGEASLPGIEHDAALDIMGRPVPHGAVTPTPVYLVGASIADIPLRFDAGPVLGAEDPADLGALGIVLDLRLLPEDDAPIGDSARKQAPEIGPDGALP